MGQSFERYQKRRLISSYFSVVLSIALVLFLLGVLGVLVINTQKLGNHFKEQIKVSIFLKDNAKQVEIDQLQQSLALASYTKEAVYVSKEDAAAMLKEEIEEDFLDFLGYNPLKNAIDLNLKADFVNEEKLEEIVSEISQKSFVAEVNYDQPLVGLLDNNIKKISFWILILSAFMTLIAVLLINASIRLALYSKRFIIKTMQMVGATKRFIRKPFLYTHIKLGIIGALLAIGALAGLLAYLDYVFPGLGLAQNPIELAVLALLILSLGIGISGGSTFFAAQRFLNLRSADLFY
ncbi:MAG: permease-like cell division protein FtsX [Flavobacteriaceae bacterium]|nr:permease-like cell division protein FtsX [Flavobacteriaceae bacterium]MCI5088055.1 permease-like cell division protein FtsX [Flavobacteriaceae bacterium]CAI8182903.1 MAG: Cell division protein FtsX [SAR116 cluster bacterium]